ncbi:MAG: hypothetical protein JWQ11_4741 [Rhizobacter sp.]|nr:hypothetical protein [Rhizobacter sp.]
MNASISWYGAFEFAVIAALIVYSAWRVAGRFAPKTRDRARKHTAAWMMAAGKPAWLVKWGTALSPKEAMAAGCGSGCGSCGGCEPAAPSKVKTVAWPTHR